jgi:hypothetical protein
MTTAELRAIRDRVQRILDNASTSTDPESKAELACFACVLTSAMLELAVRHYTARYAERRASPSVHSYVCRQLYFFQNPKCEYIDQLLRSFDATLADSFFSQVGDEGRAAIDSVVNNKNQLAHGKGAGLGLDTMLRYHTDVSKALIVLRDLMTA